jgi:primosomal protein N' (replication factor Y)
MSETSSDRETTADLFTSLPTYADVIVPRRLSQAFTYLIPVRFRHRIYPGCRVRVPFGPSVVQGVVISLFSAPAPCQTSPQTGKAPLRLREVSEVLDTDHQRDIDAELLALIRWLSDYYLAPLGQCLRLTAPPATPRSKRTRPTALHRAEPFAGSPTPDVPSVQGPSFPWQKDLLHALDQRCHLSFLWTAAAPRRLTGMMEAIAAARDRERGVLIVTPTIERAAAIASQARERWGDLVALYHSGQSAAVQAHVWAEIRGGAKPIAIGTRSAVFSPARSLGLIWIEDEHDPSLKEEQAPRYHARDVAWFRARRQQAVLVQASAHPSLETWAAFAERERSDPESSGQAPSSLAEVQAWQEGGTVPTGPTVRVVNLRDYPSGALLTDPLAASMRETLSAGKGIALLVNRKGFAVALVCRDCGDTPRCEACGVALTYYRQAARLLCPYCGRSLGLPETCGACQSTRLEPVGAGTERLEEQVKRLFPTARVARLDRDSARTAARVGAMRRLFALGEIDVLIGTKLLFQGEPLARAALVAVPYADAGLHRPDFRAAEQTFHLLTQAAGLAPPKEQGGQLVIQTSLPQHHAIMAVQKQEPRLFYRQEWASRRTLGYPPFSQVISLCLSGRQAEKVHTAAIRWSRELSAALSRWPIEQASVLGPIPAIKPQVRGRHRWQILVKVPQSEEGRGAIKPSLERLARGKKTGGLKLDVDVDPVELG